MSSSVPFLGAQDQPRSAGRRVIAWIYILFFFSGFPALLYQIVWQRALFAIYGINVQAVTTIVAAFMLGLGLGSLAGGVLSRQQNVALLRTFGAIELGIGIFGVFSLRVFHFVAKSTAGVSAAEAGALAFFLVLIPTLLMGSTLPILVSYLVQIFGNVGRSVGALYFVNTLGSATACAAAALFTMRRLGESGSITLAAGINGIIGTTVLLLSLRRHGSEPADVSAGLTEIGSVPRPGRSLLSMPVALIVSGMAGFIALAYEILWYRTYSFLSGGKADSFALLLCFYLAGIAFGSFVTLSLFRRRYLRTLNAELRAIAGFVVFANLVGYLVVPATARIAYSHGPMHSLPLVALATGLLGATLPLISDAAVRPDSHAGSGLSYIYLSNIVGSTLGSFLIGYVFMDHWSSRQIAVLIGCGGLFLAAALLTGSGMSLSQSSAAILLMCAAAGGIVLTSHRLYDRLYERLQLKSALTSDSRFRYVLENKSGVVTVTSDDEVYGGGVYDGAFNVSLVNDRNGAFRPFSMSLWHKAPNDVLMIGLSTGSWAQIIANHPQVRKLTVVEINPGYLELIARYPIVATLLRNPKVEIYIDDGRRWLIHNTAPRFDVIVMNTTFNWRANVTNLLSVEFLKIAKRHLKPGGVLFYNTTGSGEVQRTGLTVFAHGMMVGNCLAVSDTPLAVDKERWRQILTEYRIDGVPVLQLDRQSDQLRLDHLLSLPVNQRDQWESLQDAEFVQQRTQGRRLVNDDNMGTEWESDTLNRIKEVIGNLTGWSLTR